MAKEEKKDKSADDKAGEKKAEATPEEAAAKSKKRRLVIVIAGGVVLTAGIGGGLAFFLGGSGDQKMSAKSSEHGAEPNHDEHADAKKDEHGDTKAAAPMHDRLKKDEHGEKKDEHGEKKNEHGEKKDEHGADPKKEGDAKAHAKDAPKGDAKLEGVDFGCTVPLQPFHLNLGNPLENRYIRLEVAVEYGCGEEVKNEVAKRLPQLRDSVIRVTSRKTREFLLGPDGKEQLRKEVHNAINHHMTHKIDDVYITDILIE